MAGLDWEMYGAESQDRVREVSTGQEKNTVVILGGTAAEVCARASLDGRKLNAFI